MSEHETSEGGSGPGDQVGLPGERGTPEGATGPTEEDPGDVAGESMSDELGEVAGGGEIADTGPSA